MFLKAKCFNFVYLLKLMGLKQNRELYGHSYLSKVIAGNWTRLDPTEEPKQVQFPTTTLSKYTMTDKSYPFVPTDT